ncbi:hypothetical protein SAMN05444161_2728 [Rhizobiales bacterium GAS191]|nr:hypothetical protein SAMN05444161_2728 [Rhizobiales bacterium GAS191]
MSVRRPNGPASACEETSLFNGTKDRCVFA